MKSEARARLATKTYFNVRRVERTSEATKEFAERRLTVLGSDPESHVLPKHKPRLRIKSWYRTKDEHGDGN